jgi:UDP-glucose 4-epimerase
MQKVGVKTLIFSSSATVYDNPEYLQYDEDHPKKPINPYGQSKLQVEEILRDVAASDPGWKIISYGISIQWARMNLDLLERIQMVLQII